MRYNVPHLEALGVKVTDFSTPGWIPNHKTGQDLFDRVAAAGLPKDTVYVLDLLGNSSVWFKQEDDISSLLVRLNGSLHVLGDVVVMEDTHVEKTLSPVTHLYKDRLRHRSIVYPPYSPLCLR
jgi:hypothetical protein